MEQLIFGTVYLAKGIVYGMIIYMIFFVRQRQQTAEKKNLQKCAILQKRFLPYT